jgi:Cysteine-rich CPXCG
MIQFRREDSLPDDFPLGDGTADTEAHVSCPYCGEDVDIAVDPGGGAAQDYIEDCPVCCRPWRVHVSYRDDGHVRVELQEEDS